MKRRGPNRTLRTLRALLAISGVGAVLALYSAWSAAGDVRIATGPTSAAQRAWFVKSADRPDLATFFKGLSRDQKFAMATAVCAYDDEAVAKIVGKCIETFDPETRARFSQAMKGVAAKHPQAVIDEMAGGGGIKQRAIADALHPLGDSILAAVAAKLEVADARNNAVQFLADSGSSAIAVVRPKLTSKDKDVRLAAADCLGKLHATAAFQDLLRMAQTGEIEERPRYWAAIASIGAPESEPYLTALVRDAKVDGSQRAQAALGLGRIASPSALKTIAEFATADETPLRRACIDALRSAGDPGLAVAPTPETRVEVAAGIDSATADAALRQGLADPKLARLAASLCGDRPRLSSDLIEAARRWSGDGEVIDAVVDALAESQTGRAKLAQLRTDAALGGFVRRRLG